MTMTKIKTIKINKKIWIKATLKMKQKMKIKILTNWMTLKQTPPQMINPNNRNWIMEIRMN